MTRRGSSLASDRANGSTTAASRGWWFEDAVPGVTLRHPGGRTIVDADHVWLAWVTGNASDVHGNAHRAEAGGFGRPVVLGALTVAIVVGLAKPADTLPTLHGGQASQGWSSIRLRAPVFAGDTIHAESTFHAAHMRAGRTGGTVRRTIRGRNQRAETVVEVEETREVPSAKKLNKGLLTPY